MKTALITTTINVPTVLELYRQHGPDVAFFVAGDLKTPHAEVIDCLKGLGVPAFYLHPEYQDGWLCSDLINWNCVQRRNIALLEACKWGADIIVSVDDDNIPLDRWTESTPSYFYRFQALLRRDSLAPSRVFNGVKVSSPTGWFDVGTLLDPVSPHRGFPHDVESQMEISHVVGARVGVAAGVCIGDPDISAVTRMSYHPIVHRVSQLLESGIVVDPSTHTVFNSQNSAIIRELAPAWGMVPFVQRYDDILASLVCARVMRQRGLYIHFGKPFAYQQRNSHDLVKDLKGEILGMEIVKHFAFVLDETPLQGKSVIDDCRAIWREVNKACLLSEKSVEAMLAYVDDCEGLGL